MGSPRVGGREVVVAYCGKAEGEDGGSCACISVQEQLENLTPLVGLEDFLTCKSQLQWMGGRREGETSLLFTR